MENNFKKFSDIIQNIKLSPDEHFRIKRHIERVMKGEVDVSPYVIPSHMSRWIRPVQYATLVLIIIAISGVSVSSVAQAALPGDALYGFKINVSENIKSLTKTTPEAKARYEIERVNKRFEETAVLVAQGRLNNEASSVINMQIEKHSDKAQESAQQLESLNPNVALDLGTELATSLETYSKVFGEVKIITNSNGELSSIIDASEKLAIKIHANLELVEKSIVDKLIETQETDADLARIKAERKLEEVSKRYTFLKESIIRDFPSLTPKEAIVNNTEEENIGAETNEEFTPEKSPEENTSNPESIVSLPENIVENEISENILIEIPNISIEIESRVTENSVLQSVSQNSVTTTSSVENTNSEVDNKIITTLPESDSDEINSVPVIPSEPAIMEDEIRAFFIEIETHLYEAETLIAEGNYSLSFSTVQDAVSIMQRLAILILFEAKIQEKFVIQLEEARKNEELNVSEKILTEEIPSDESFINENQ